MQNLTQPVRLRTAPPTASSRNQASSQLRLLIPRSSPAPAKRRQYEQLVPWPRHFHDDFRPKTVNEKALTAALADSTQVLSGQFASGGPPGRTMVLDPAG